MPADSRKYPTKAAGAMQHKAKNNIMQMHLLAHNGGFFHDLV